MAARPNLPPNESFGKVLPIPYIHARPLPSTPWGKDDFGVYFWTEPKLMGDPNGETARAACSGYWSANDWMNNKPAVPLDVAEEWHRFYHAGGPRPDDKGNQYKKQDQGVAYGVAQ
jgi:hypothetical protein